MHNSLTINIIATQAEEDAPYSLPARELLTLLDEGLGPQDALVGTRSRRTALVQLLLNMHSEQDPSGTRGDERLSLPLALAHMVIAEMDYEELNELFGMCSHDE